MNEQNARQGYSAYIKAAYAAVFTISTFMIAKSTGYLFGSSDSGEENKVDENIENIKQNSLGLRRSIEQTTNPIINQETLQSLQLINGAFAGKYNISDIQDMVIKDSIAYIAAGNNGFQIVDVSNISNPIITGRYQLTGGFAHQLNLVGNYAYVAYDLAGLIIVDITNPYNISLAGVYMAGENPTREPVVKVAVEGNKALVITDLENGQFEWVDISQPTKIFRVYLDTQGNALRVSVVGGIAYVANYDSGLQLINVSNPANPSLISSFYTPGYAHSVAVVGDVAYVADYQAGLQLINVSNPANPSLLGSFTTSGTANDVSVAGGIAYMAGGPAGLQLIDVSNSTNPSLLGSFYVSGNAWSVSVVGGVAYVGYGYFGFLGSLQLIDVSNPANLSLLSNFNTPGTAYGVSVISGIAYVAAYSSGLQLINVSNPNNPRLLASFSTPGQAWDVSVLDNIAYVADRASVARRASGLQLINVSDPINPTLLGSFNSVSAFGVSVISGIAYVANSYAGLQVFDLSNGFSSYLRTDILENKNKFINDVCTMGNTFFYTEQDRGLVLVDDPNFIVGRFNTGVDGYSVSVAGGIAYVTDYNSIYLINVSNPANPSLLSRSNTLGLARDVTIVGGIAYVANYYAGLQLIDVSNPTNPSLLGSFYAGGTAVGVSVVGGIAYVAARDAGLQLINVSNPTNISLLGSFITSGYANGISVVAGIAYVANYYVGLQLIDVSNPANLSLLGSFNTGSAYGANSGSHYGVSVVGGIAYLSGYGLLLIDVSNPANPSLLGRFSTSGYANDVSVVGGNAYLAEAGLLLIDVNDPSHPQLVQNYNIPETVQKVFVSDEFIYVESSNSLQIVKLATEKSSFGSTPWVASQATVQNNTAYLSDTGKNLYLLDVTNTSNPVEISRYALSYHATDMVVSTLENDKYTYLYVAQSLEGVEVIDMTNKSFPVFAGRIARGIDNAKTLQINGNKLYVNNNNVEILVFDITVLHYLNVSENNVNLNQGTTIITNTELNVIAVNPFDIATDDINNIVYSINNLQQGQFELVNTTTLITSFTQAQINTNQIQFIYTGNGTNPSFDFTLNNGNITAGPYTGKISLIRAPQIITNKLICNEGQTVAVTSNEISAIDIDGTSNPNLLFVVDEMGNGQFELTSNPGVIVTQFSQDDINENQVQFTPIDSGRNTIVTVNDIKPFYQLTVTNGQNQSSINNATIDFDAAPKIIENQLTIGKGQSIILSPENLNATDIDNNFIGNLSFQVSNETNGQFEEINNPSIKLSYFTQQQINNQQIKFVHDNSDVAPNYRINVTDGRATSPQSSPTVSFNNKEAGINIGLVAGGVIGGIAGLGMLIAGGGFFAKTYRDTVTRDPFPFANAVHKHLKLNGMDNFKTEQGQKFVRLMEEDMAQALLPYGFDIQNLHLQAMDDLAKNIAAEAKNKITVSTTTFGYSQIQLDQLESKINDIAQSVGLRKDMNQTINSSLENDSEIGLKNFTPTFKLRATKFENV